MSVDPHPNLFSASNAKAYKDILVELNDESTVKTLNKKIEELEKRIDDQEQHQNHQELEFCNRLDRKKVRWVLKYLEMKLELENLKKFYQDGKKLWQDDIKNLCKVIHILWGKIKEKDEQHIEQIKHIEREVNQLYQIQDLKNSKLKESNPYTTHTASTEEQDDTNERLTIQPREETDTTSIFDTVHKDVRFEDTYFLSPHHPNQETLVRQELIKNNLNRYTTPLYVNISNRSTETRKKLSDPRGTENGSSVSKPAHQTIYDLSYLSALLKGINSRIRKYIIEANDNLANQQYEFDDAINKTLKRVQCILKSENDNILENPILKSAMKESFSVIEAKKSVLENDKRSFVSIQSYRRSNIGGSFKSSECGIEDRKMNLNMSHGDHTPNNSIFAIVNNNITPTTNDKMALRSSIKKSEEKSINSYKLLQKIFKTGDVNSSKNNKSYIQRIYEDVQESLSISEREAILYTLIDGHMSGKKNAHNEDKDFIRIEDLLDMGPNSPSQSQFNKFKQNTISRPLFDDGVSADKRSKEIKEGLRSSNNLNNIAVCDTLRADSLQLNSYEFSQIVPPQFRASEVEQPKVETNIFDLSDISNNCKSNIKCSNQKNDKEFVLPTTIKQNNEITQSFRIDDTPIIKKSESKYFVDNKGIIELKSLISASISPIVAKSETISKRINFDTLSPIHSPSFGIKAHENLTYGSKQSQSQGYELKTPIVHKHIAATSSTENENMITELSSTVFNQSKTDFHLSLNSFERSNLYK